jgi:hypothetical protein
MTGHGLVRLLVQRREDLLQVGDLLARLGRVVAELPLELFALSVRLELAERLQDNVLHLQSGAELVGEELSRRLELVEHDSPFGSSALSQ